MNRAENPISDERLLASIQPAQALAVVERTAKERNILPELPKGPIHTVIYLSVLAENANKEALIAQDPKAHKEAENSGGLILYAPGDIRNKETAQSPSTETDDVFEDPRVIVNFCFWDSEDDANRASQLPEHKKARLLGFANHQEVKIFVGDVDRDEEDNFYFATLKKELNFPPIEDHQDAA